MKQSNLIYRLLLLCMTTVFIAACQTGQSGAIEYSMADEEDTEQAQQTDTETTNNNTDTTTITALGDGGEGSTIPLETEVESTQDMLDKANSPISNRIIYFKFDDAKVSKESLATLAAHGEFIASNSNVSVRLEGHSDERGSREYNIALGDRRAQSVRGILLFSGASSDQLETISYGEEQPAMLGHTEEAWFNNRRVEIVYQVK